MDASAILDLVTKAGPYGLFALAFYMWRLEREERIATQKSFVTLMADGLRAMTGTENALRELRQTFFGHATHSDG